MTLATLLRVAPIRNAVLGPSAESLRVSYRGLGISVRVTDNRMPAENGVVIKQLEPTLIFNEDRYFASIKDTNLIVEDAVPSVLSYPSVILDISTTTVSAKTNQTITSPISIEVYDA